MASQKRAYQGKTTGYSTRNSTKKEFDLRWHELNEAKLIPESWAENGERHDIPEGKDAFYAFQAKAGLLLEYEVDRQGTPISGPHREEPGLRVLYVTADGERVFVREFIAIENGTQGFKPPSSFPSVTAPMDQNRVSEYPRPVEGRKAVADLYDNRVC
ncbi:hypothetical protein [Haloarcula sp. Atlit-7R]|uniref:hypothetical protein n=1 Tax=Haloarcula sp. Atlit-7R TaxID=2282125 RepID=UPI000EF1532C|nr:hypothetical protein [Haloarcula sp. Atlit-7R]RLM94296.1 hypothetical protein D3D01_15650 [Haloarcula sp. Atlit-7R]